MTFKIIAVFSNILCRYDERNLIFHAALIVLFSMEKERYANHGFFCLVSPS